MRFQLKRTWLATALVYACALLAGGCGAGSADIPADLPAPKPLGGTGAPTAEEAAKSQGLKPPTAMTKIPKTYDPTSLHH